MIHLHFSIPAIWLIYGGGVVMFVISRPEFKSFAMLSVLPGYTIFLIYNIIALLTTHKRCTSIIVHAVTALTKRESKFKLVEDTQWLMFQTESTWVIGLLFLCLKLLSFFFFTLNMTYPGKIFH